MEIPLSFQLQPNPATYILGISLATIEYIGKLPFLGKLPIKAKGITDIG